MDDKWRKDPNKRARADRHLKVVQDQVQKQDKSIEDLELENAQSEVMEGGIPVMWGTPGMKRAIRGRNASIKTPDSKEQAQFQQQGKLTCSSCEHFNIKTGREEIIKQDFARRLVLEQEWALRHLGAGLDHLGLCDQANGELAVTTMSPACDRWCARKGTIR